MRIKRFNDVNLLGIAGTEIDIPAGRSAGISISYYGTNGAGATLALADIGLLRLTYMGEPMLNARAVTLFDYDDFKGGLPPFASAAGAAFRTTFHIPFRFGGYGPDNPDDNVINIQHGQMRLFLPSPVTAVALPAAVNVEIALIEDPSGNSRYLPYIFDNQHTLTQAYDVKLNGPNIRCVMIQRPVGVGTLPVSVQFAMNGMNFLEGPWTIIEDNTNIYNRIEAAVIQAMLAEFGNANPASWQGGRYKCLLVGANPGDTMWVSEFGARSITTSEYLRTQEAATSDLASFRMASESPANVIVCPIYAGKLPVQPHIITPPNELRYRPPTTDRGTPENDPIRGPVSPVVRPSLESV